MKESRVKLELWLVKKQQSLAKARREECFLFCGFHTDLLFARRQDPEVVLFCVSLHHGHRMACLDAGTLWECSCPTGPHAKALLWVSGQLWTTAVADWKYQPGQFPAVRGRFSLPQLKSSLLIKQTWENEFSNVSTR